MYLNMSYVLNVFYVKIYLRCQDKVYILRTNYLLMFVKVYFKWLQSVQITIVLLKCIPFTDPY